MVLEINEFEDYDVYETATSIKIINSRFIATEITKSDYRTNAGQVGKAVLCSIVDVADANAPVTIAECKTAL